MRPALALLPGTSLFLAIACLTAPLTMSARHAAQQATEKSPDLKPFLGTWKAMFQGSVLAVLVLKEEKGEIAGTLNNFDVVFDAQGNLAEGTHTDYGDAPLLRVRMKPGKISFVVMEKDQYHASDEWRFVPKTADEGELTYLLDGKPYTINDTPVKPIRMTRESATPKHTQATTKTQ